MDHELSREIKTLTGCSIALGILMIVLGIAAISFPLATSIAAAIWIAWLLILCGVVELVYGIQTRKEGGWGWKLLNALAYLVAGFFLAFNPFGFVIVLTLMLGIFLVVQGVIELILAFQLRPSPNWGWLLFSGVLTLLLGAMIWSRWPSNAPWLIGLLVGISFISSGISRVMLSLAVRQIVNQDAFEPNG